MKTTFSIQFFCRPSKANKQGEAPIELSIVICGQRTYLQLPYKCSPKVFNQKRRPKEIENYLNAQRMNINNILTEITQNGEILTAHSLKSYLQKGGYKSYSVKDLFNDFLAIQKQRVGKTLTEGVYKKYVYIKEQFFKDFDENKECSAITNQVVQLFFAKIDRAYQNSTACGYKTRFKAFIHFGMDNNKIKVNPLQGIRIIKEKKPITYLTLEEINKLKTAKLDNECLSKIRDCAIFQINSGLAFADCVSLTPNDLQEKDGTYYIRKRRNKTGNFFMAVILPDGVKIWNKYKGELPFISNQKYNLFLKAVALEAGIDKRIHSHIFRHTYATNLLNSGVSLKTVSRCIGDTLKIADSFYAHLKDETILQEVSKVL